MERKGYVRPIQRGGDGTGFKTPRQILQVEPQRASQISRELLLRGSQLLPTRSGKEAESSLSNFGDSPKHMIWMRELEYRLFLLGQLRAEQAMTESRIPTLSNQIDFGVRSQPEAGFQMDANRMMHNSLPLRINTTRVASTKGADFKTSRPPVIKYISGLPKTVEKAIELWRRGGDGYKASRLFEKVEARRRLIPNYENRMWARSGQKHCFFRLKAVAELVSEFGPVTIRLESEGRDDQWNTGLQNYHAHFDRNGKPLSLTVALQHANDI